MIGLASTKLEISVFLSCTSKDLRLHRDRVREILEKHGYQIIDMTRFGAQDRTGLETSLREISPADVFVGIYAHRYGYVPLGSDISITEAEYHEATRLGKPRLIFLLEPKYVGEYDDVSVSNAISILDEEKSDVDYITAFRDDNDPDKKRKLSAFIALIEANLTRDTFTTPDALAQRVLFALSKWEGWRTIYSPAPSRKYVGRHDQVRQITGLLETQKRVALIGMGGIGKTLTAQQIAHISRDKYTAGVLWATLGSEARDAEAVLSRTMEAWAQVHHPGRLVSAGDLKPEMLRSWLENSPSPLLIVFDDIWYSHVFDTLMQLVPENAQLLITSRHRDALRNLRANQEAFVEITKLSDSEAIELLRDRGIDDTYPPSILRRIVEKLDGHALALELVAGLAREIRASDPDYPNKLPDLLESMQNDITEFKGLEIPDDERNLNIESVLSLSYAHMDTPLKQCFRLLGILAPDALLPREVILELWEKFGNIPSDLNDAEHRLNTLLNKSVLSREGDYFRLHRLLSLYGHALLSKHSETPMAEQTYLELVVEQAENTFRHPTDTWLPFETGWSQHISFNGNRLAMQMSQYVPSERPETRTVLHVFMGPAKLQPSSVFRIHNTTVGNTSLRSIEVDLDAPYAPIPRNDEEQTRIGTRLHALSMSAPKDIPPTLIAQSKRFALAMEKYVTSRPVGDDGRNWLLAGLTSARVNVDANAIAVMLSALGTWHVQYAFTEEALVYHNDARYVAQSLADADLLATTSFNVAQMWLHVGNPVYALEIYEHALSSANDAGNVGLVIDCLTKLGQIYQRLQRVDQALRYYTDALARLVEVKDYRREAVIYAALGELSRTDQKAQISRDGKVLTSNDLFDLSILCYRRIGDVRGEATVLNMLAKIHFDNKEFEQAVRELNDALEKFIAAQDWNAESATRTILAMNLLSLNESDETAIEHLRIARSLRQQSGVSTRQQDMLLAMYEGSHQSLASLMNALLGASSQLFATISEDVFTSETEKEIARVVSALSNIAGWNEAEKYIVENHSLMFSPLTGAVIIKMVQAINNRSVINNLCNWKTILQLWQTQGADKILERLKTIPSINVLATIYDPEDESKFLDFIHESALSEEDILMFITTLRQAYKH